MYSSWTMGPPSRHIIRVPSKTWRSGHEFWAFGTNRNTSNMPLQRTQMVHNGYSKSIMVQNHQHACDNARDVTYPYNKNNKSECSWNTTHFWTTIKNLKTMHPGEIAWTRTATGVTATTTCSKHWTIRTTLENDKSKHQLGHRLFEFYQRHLQNKCVAMRLGCYCQPYQPGSNCIAMLGQKRMNEGMRNVREKQALIMIQVYSIGVD